MERDHRQCANKGIGYDTQYQLLHAAFILHETRNTAMAVTGLLDLIDTYPESTDEYLQILKEYGQVLTRLSQDNLDQLTPNAPTTTASVNLPPLFRHIVSPFALEARSKGITIECDIATLPQANVSIDAVRLRQILMNLLRNALQHTTAKGRINITAMHKDNTLFCSVSDSGNGIAPELIGRLFKEPIIQPHGEAEKGQSNGLGLRICQSLVTAMNGDIEVLSTSSEGTTITFHVEAKLVQ